MVITKGCIDGSLLRLAMDTFTLSQFQLSDKVAIVTGGAGIIGSHFCKGLADAGAQVAVVDINIDSARDLASTIGNKYDVKASGYECDVSRPDSVKLAVSEITQDFGHVDILINNAATKSDDLEAFFSSFEDYELEQWRKIMAVDIDGMFLMAQAVGKQMKLQKTGGSITQISSVYGIVAPDQRIYDGAMYEGHKINSPAAYSVAKAGVIGLTKHLAAYWAREGIRVNSITPGGVESGQNESFISNYSNRVPMNRMAQAAEIVGAAIYLSSSASSYVTGQNIIIDGGLTVW